MTNRPCHSDFADNDPYIVGKMREFTEREQANLRRASPESTPATLGDLQALELRIARDHRVILDRIARLERQVKAIPGFLESLK